MFRVLFKVIQISIHIKENLSLEFVFKKGNETISSKDLYPLIDGISSINTTTEFLITKADPKFELHVNFTFRKVKKQAGYILINLRDWTEGCSYQEIRKLQNSPGGKAMIEFGFIYFNSGVSSLPKSLQSFQVFEKAINKEYREKIAEQNLILGQNLKELIHIKESLTDQKEIHNQIEAQFQKTEALIDEEVNYQEKKMDEVQNMLKEEQEKQAFLRELVEKSGSQHLMNYMKEINQAGMKMGNSQTLKGQSLGEQSSFDISQ